MAAGMGSRFGGLKQMEPVGPRGEVILDFSAYDAIKAGFTKIVFVIKHEIEADFKAIVGDHISEKIKVEYAFQEVDNLPEGFTCPSDRTKPWGTAHAILSCKGMDIEKGITDTREPFAELKKAFFGSARKVILAIDHTKFDKISFVHFGSFDDIDVVVTDVEPDDRWKHLFAEKNIELYY
jgi:hypothetical protein